MPQARGAYHVAVGSQSFELQPVEAVVYYKLQFTVDEKLKHMTPHCGP